MAGDEQMLSLANDLRTKISDLLEVDRSDRIILAPGILVALRILFAHLRTERILLTSGEYYDADHFPEASVEVSRCEAISDLVLQREYAAVVASPATWRGTRQPVAEQFASIRKALGREAPLLVADYAHAGSIGFPSIDALGADVVCGDLEKWILPPDWNSRVAFLWFRTEGLFRRATAAFRPFFLATQAPNVSMSARWVDPADVRAVSRRLADLGVTGARLRERHRADIEFARGLAERLHASRMPETSILWFEEDELDAKMVEDLEKMGLVWRLPGRGTRVLCRSDVAVRVLAHEKTRPPP
jgi:hypothetical protein